MIISHRFRLIFVKTHKTAGSSFEYALGPLCGPEDVVTPMGLKRPENYARNYHADSGLGAWYGRSRWLRKLVSRESRLIEPWFWEHMPLSRVRAQLPEDQWTSYRKVCIERNPWDKVVSYYLWKKHGQKKEMPSFRDYVLHKSHRLPLDGRLYLDEGGEAMVDEIVDFRDFLKDHRRFTERWGLPDFGELPREKTGKRPGRMAYQDYYDEETRAKVGELFAREIALCGYQFDDKRGAHLPWGMGEERK